MRGTRKRKALQNGNSRKSRSAATSMWGVSSLLLFFGVAPFWGVLSWRAKRTPSFWRDWDQTKKRAANSTVWSRKSRSATERNGAFLNWGKKDFGIFRFLIGPQEPTRHHRHPRIRMNGSAGALVKFLRRSPVGRVTVVWATKRRKNTAPPPSVFVFLFRGAQKRKPEKLFGGANAPSQVL